MNFRWHSGDGQTPERTVLCHIAGDRFASGQRRLIRTLHRGIFTVSVNFSVKENGVGGFRDNDGRRTICTCHAIVIRQNFQIVLIEINLVFAKGFFVGAGGASHDEQAAVPHVQRTGTGCTAPDARRADGRYVAAIDIDGATQAILVGADARFALAGCCLQTAGAFRLAIDVEGRACRNVDSLSGNQAGAVPENQVDDAGHLNALADDGALYIRRGVPAVGSPVCEAILQRVIFRRLLFSVCIQILDGLPAIDPFGIDRVTACDCLS